MRTFLFLLKDKKRGEQTEDRLLGHIAHLQRLKESNHLLRCGPFQDNDGAVQIIRAESEKLAQIINNLKDPLRVRE